MNAHEQVSRLTEFGSLPEGLRPSDTRASKRLRRQLTHLALTTVWNKPENIATAGRHVYTRRLPRSLERFEVISAGDGSALTWRLVDSNPDSHPNRMGLDARLEYDEEQSVGRALLVLTNYHFPQGDTAEPSSSYELDLGESGRYVNPLDYNFAKIRLQAGIAAARFPILPTFVTDLTDLDV